MKTFTKAEIKALYKGPRPPFLRDAVMLKNILSGAWSDVSPDFVDAVREAFKTGNVDDIRETLKTLPDLQSQIGDKIDSKVDSLAISLQSRANAYYLDRLGKDSTDIPKDRKELIQEKWATEVKAFASKYPERILAPEFERIIENMQAGRYVDVSEISDIVDRLLENHADDYYDALSSVEANRCYQETSVNLASENDYGTLMWSALGPQPCSVCASLDGTTIETADAKDRFDTAQDIDDPDELTSHWEFPRLADVDRKDPEELSGDCNCPPAHPDCNCVLVPLS
jgi:hypothetical protein